MRLQYHVISQKMAQALHELRVHQHARYFWVGETILPHDAIVPGFTKNSHAAFDSAEIGWMLPERFVFETFLEGGRERMSAIIRANIKGKVLEFSAQTEVGARARLLICLIENGLMIPTAKTGA